ncbi:hypothetical protein SAMN05443377_10598 [Propionibacterium cyclohexanicum]|uniref:Uncharacterized protein n=1 Tax=Propionibacterium cyclohexanicum TaxID=64702 RepID=A0A1H9R327_9ACTN|nr:hypothetical protein SAMN05443377_10598 [Propionibacterium cyclohexanicum]
MSVSTIARERGLVVEHHPSGHVHEPQLAPVLQARVHIRHPCLGGSALPDAMALMLALTSTGKPRHPCEAPPVWNTAPDRVRILRRKQPRLTTALAIGLLGDRRHHCDARDSLGTVTPSDRRRLKERSLQIGDLSAPSLAFAASLTSRPKAMDSVITQETPARLEAGHVTESATCSFIWPSESNVASLRVSRSVLQVVRRPLTTSYPMLSRDAQSCVSRFCTPPNPHVIAVAGRRLGLGRRRAHDHLLVLYLAICAREAR